MNVFRTFSAAFPRYNVLAMGKCDSIAETPLVQVKHLIALQSSTATKTFM